MSAFYDRLKSYGPPPLQCKDWDDAFLIALAISQMAADWCDDKELHRRMAFLGPTLEPLSFEDYCDIRALFFVAGVITDKLRMTAAGKATAMGVCALYVIADVRGAATR